ncbi:hypothetical protein E3N88_22723 [Mikania micrantha]|uniref:Uncharacterized protein n=1 Tax=Mikania micrantha TaxID=192012 RepID=A0A5N6NB94_9ASTR|nr:hypothetical protein E3N88_22723 [Mikania micrantha]
MFTLIQVNGGIKVLDLVQLMGLADPFVFDLEKLPLDNPDNGAEGRVAVKWVRTRAQTNMCVVSTFCTIKGNQLQSLSDDYPQKSLSLEDTEENLRKPLSFRSFMSSKALKL